MTGIWFPPATVDPIGDYHGAGEFKDGQPKIIHHITGGSTYAGARATYASTGYLPHFTTSYERARFGCWQHLPVDVAATALRHPAGTPETNKAHAIQIEHVTVAEGDVVGWPGDYLDHIAILCRWIEAVCGVQRRADYPFVNPRRLTWPEWVAAAGHLGHCHVPGNDHIDPGPIDIGHILNAGQSPPPTPITETDMPYAIDPQTGGLWICPPDGGVRAEAGARFLGSLPAHPEWHAGGGEANGPAIAIGAVGDGYTIYTQDAQGVVHPYHFSG